jgi:putative transposase
MAIKGKVRHLEIEVRKRNDNQASSNRGRTSSLYGAETLHLSWCVTRSGCYRYLRRKVRERDQEVKEQIQAVDKQRKGINGYCRIQMEVLHQYNNVVNHKKVLRLMQEMWLRSIIRRKRNFEKWHGGYS